MVFLKIWFILGKFEREPFNYVCHLCRGHLESLALDGVTHY